MQDLKTTSTIELIKELTRLEKEIDYDLLKYNRIVKELYYRIPILEKQNEIKPKMLIKTKIDL